MRYKNSHDSHTFRNILRITSRNVRLMHTQTLGQYEKE
jgi:hypothetical protein